MDIYNIFIFSFSLGIVFFSIFNIAKYGLKSSTSFLFSFYFCLAFSCFKLSKFQTEKTIIDVYYFFMGPAAFILPILCLESIHTINFKKIKIKFNFKSVYWILLAAYIALKIYISMNVGWRIESVLYSNFLMSGDNFTMPGYSGISAILQWTLVIFFPYANKAQRTMLIISLILFSVLHVKRGDIMRLFSFLLCFYTYQLFLTRKNPFLIYSKIFLFVVFVLSVFIVTGNIRQQMRGDETVSYLSNNLGINTKSSFSIWMYGYFFINYEVVRGYYNVEHNYNFSSIETLIVNENNDKIALSINNFNAATFISVFIRDSGYLYFFEMLIFGIIVGIIIYLSNAFYFSGLKIFISSILLQSFFGNYLSNRAIFSSLIFSLVIFPFLRLHNKNEA